MGAGTNSHYSPRAGKIVSQRRGNDRGRKKSGCYVATAIYGSYDCPEVWTLRRYRDYHLSQSYSGRAFVKVYYALSPYFVRKFGKTDWFNRFFQTKLDKMVRRLQAQGYSSDKYEDIEW